MYIITISDNNGSFIIFPVSVYLFHYFLILLCFIGYDLQRTKLYNSTKGESIGFLETKLLILLSIIFTIYSGIIDLNKDIPFYS